MSGLDVPVVLIFYNRADKLREVFRAVAEARPRQLFLVADGPKNAEDADRCRAARAVVEAIDWPCDVRRDYSEKNLGNMRRVSSGIDWVFEHVERAMVLEDDCLPSRSFFPFCAELLDRYADDARIMEITGSNYQPNDVAAPYSYYFSGYYGCWGWATWRRAWRLYDPGIVRWPETYRAGLLSRWCPDWIEREVWRQNFDLVFDRAFDTWDWQWQFAMWLHGGLSIVPAKNLVTNIGFGTDATTTVDLRGPTAMIPRHELGPLAHPPILERNREADRVHFDRAEGGYLFRGPRGVLRLVKRALRHRTSRTPVLPRRR